MIKSDSFKRSWAHFRGWKLYSWPLGNTGYAEFFDFLFAKFAYRVSFVGGGLQVGFFQLRASPLTPWLGWIVLKFCGFLPPTFAHFLQPALAHFLNVVYFFNTIWIFLWHINVFNVRQVNIRQNKNLLFHIFISFFSRFLLTILQ